MQEYKTLAIVEWEFTLAWTKEGSVGVEWRNGFELLWRMNIKPLWRLVRCEIWNLGPHKLRAQIQKEKHGGREKESHMNSISTTWQIRKKRYCPLVCTHSHSRSTTCEVRQSIAFSSPTSTAHQCPERFCIFGHDAGKRRCWQLLQHSSEYLFDDQKKKRNQR